MAKATASKDGVQMRLAHMRRHAGTIKLASGDAPVNAETTEPTELEVNEMTSR
jgi:hypothetical protein